MVFGQTYEEWYATRRVFALLPHWLEDGRIVWLQHVWRQRKRLSQGEFYGLYVDTIYTLEKP